MHILMYFKQKNINNDTYILKNLIVFFIVFFTCLPQMYAQKKVKEVVDTIPRIGQWNIRTNAFDWVLTIPNIAVEYDLSNNMHNKYTVGAQVKYNWNTTHKFKPGTVFNVLDARIEGRYYFPTRNKQSYRPDSVKVSLWTRLREDVFTDRWPEPRFWRRYYVGAYTNYASYSIKLGKRGVQGSGFGFGFSYGFTTPLYSYPNGHVIDFELGGSAGFMFASRNVYEHDPESDCYPLIKEKSKGMSLIPYPLITDLRVAFVYRFTALKNKYKVGKSQKQLDKEEERLKAKQAKEAINDSINALRKIQKEAELRRKIIDKAVKQGIDTLTLNVDSIIKASQPLSKEEREALRLAKKQQKLEAEKAQQAAQAERDAMLNAMTPEERKAFEEQERKAQKKKKEEEKALKQAEKAAEKARKEAEKQQKKEKDNNN